MPYGRYKHSLVLGTALMLILSACVINTARARKQTIIVDTPKVDAAECELTDNRGKRWFVDETPGVATVPSGYGPMAVICTKKGYKRTAIHIPEDIPYDKTGQYRYIAENVFGFFDDPVQSLGNRYPDRLIILMEPEHFQSEQEKRDWLTVLRSYERVYNEPQAQKRTEELKELDKQIAAKKELKRLEAEQKAAAKKKAESFIDKNAKINQQIKRIEKNLGKDESANAMPPAVTVEPKGGQPEQPTQPNGNPLLDEY